MRIVIALAALSLALWHGLAAISDLSDGIWTTGLYFGLVLPPLDYHFEPRMQGLFEHGFWAGPLQAVVGLIRGIPAVGVLLGTVWWLARDGAGLLRVSAIAGWIVAVVAVAAHSLLSWFFDYGLSEQFAIYWGEMRGWEMAFTLSEWRLVLGVVLEVLGLVVLLVLTGAVAVGARARETEAASA